MALSVRITRRAARDIAEIRTFILRSDRASAEKVRRSIVQAIELLADYPHIGPMTEIPQLRMKLVPPLPYRIYYRVTPDAVEVLHVRHTARQAPGFDELS